MRLIDADNLESIKFHSLPYTHITPTDADAESYKRGWNDAIDSIIENEPTIEPDQEKPAKWIIYEVANCDGEPPIAWECPECGEVVNCKYKFCPECGKPMEL